MSDRPTIAPDLLSRARAAVRAGRRESAVEAYTALLEADATHAEALSFLALAAFEDGDHARSRALLDTLLAAHPDRAAARRDRALLRSAAGDAAGARADLEHLVTLVPDDARAWLELAAAAAATDDEARALAACQQALHRDARLADARIADNLPAPLPALARAARRRVRTWVEARQQAALDTVADTFGATTLARVRQALAILQGHAPPAWNHAQQQPSFLLIPDLPAQPWFAAEEFEWHDALCAEHPVILAEYHAARRDAADLRPYVAADAARRPEWAALAGQPAWSALHLWQAGEARPATQARCPATTALLARLPLPVMRGHAPEAFFSVLAPGAHIPPHFGLANTKLVVHLGLDVPPDCAIRVGAETRTWSEGGVLVFDDSFEHEAWNRGARPRVVFITEVWNPALSAAERAAIAALVDALDDLQHLPAAP